MTEGALSAALEGIGIELENSLIQKAVTMCETYGIQAEEVANEWEAYTLNTNSSSSNNSNTNSMSTNGAMEQLDSVLSNLMKKHNRNHPATTNTTNNTTKSNFKNEMSTSTPMLNVHTIHMKPLCLLYILFIWQCAIMLTVRTIHMEPLCLLYILFIWSHDAYCTY